MTVDPHIKAVGFDMDGTVMDTKVDYQKLGRIVLDEFISLGIPQDVIDLDVKANSMDNGLKWLAENSPGDLEGFDKRVGDRATEVELEFSDIARPYPGARENIERIRSHGYKTALLTRGGRKYATKILSASGMMDLFDGLVARDDFPYKEAKPDKRAMEHMCQTIAVKCNEVLYIGDGSADYYTTVNAGSQFVGVETHISRADWERMAGPDVMTIPTIADLCGFMGI